ncbi:MAG: hypothetical protein WBH04_02880, partial [Albidovulum sp.]
RYVLIGLSMAAILACAMTLGVSSFGSGAIYFAAAFFGATTMPIFSVSTAHGHDFASDEERVELSAAFMFLYAIGAIASPLIAAQLIDSFGASAMFVFLTVAHLMLIAFGLLRMRARPAPQDRTSYVNMPRTSFLIGRLLGRTRSKR